ncbi:MAG: DUF4265 domain-containing protein [Planctomycetota bacterium]
MIPDRDRTLTLAFPVPAEKGRGLLAEESLPLVVSEGGMRLLAPPLMVPELSVGDVLSCVIQGDSGRVESWGHIARSDRSTVWLAPRGDGSAVRSALEELRSHGCASRGDALLGIFAVDVPSAAIMDAAEDILARLERDGVSVAYPSDRRADPSGL